MSNVVWPTLPGLGWSVIKTPKWNTKIQTGVSGREQRTAMAAYPIYSFSLFYEILRGGSPNLELEKLMGFFLARQGSYDNFLFTDANDNAVTAQSIGSGNASTTAFQLTRTFGAGGFLYTEPTMNINSTPSIYLNGVLKTVTTDYTINSTGMVTFTTPPGIGVAVTWTGSYYYRCRFVKDSSDFEQFMQNLWTLKQCDLTGSLGVKI